MIVQVLTLLLLSVVTAQNQCPGISPYALSIGAGFDATKINLRGTASIESQYFTNIPMKRTPGECWFNPFTNRTEKIWNEMLIPTPMSQFVNSTKMFEIDTYDEFDESLSVHFGAEFFGIGKASEDWSEYLQVALNAGASRITSQGQFVAFRIDANERHASDDLISAVSNLCTKWHVFGCWENWVVMFSDPINGFGTHYPASTAMGGGWNYKKFSTYFQLKIHGSAQLVAAAELDFLNLIHASGCVCGSVNAEVDWYVSAGSEKTNCFGGTQPELCSQNNPSSWTQWLESVPAEPVSLMYLDDNVVFPKFQPIWSLFNSSYAELQTLYKDASTAYITWAGVESVKVTYENVMGYLQGLINTPPIDCLNVGCPNRCGMSGNASLLNNVKANATLMFNTLNETHSFIVKILNSRPIIGYKIDVVLPFITNWTTEIGSIIQTLFQDMTFISCMCAWSNPRGQPSRGGCSTVPGECCYTPSTMIECWQGVIPQPLTCGWAYGRGWAHPPYLNAIMYVPVALV